MYTNALADEKSPYLRQHAHNPVNWLPWGEAAFARAREEDKPIFLSIGYSTCHWCHVMAHESFEDAATAKVLNAHFIAVKMDREERPDIDRVYMLFVQASTGSGGWPMSVWLTPDLRPFYGGTYFPPDNRYGRPGFRSLLEHLAGAWERDRARILESSAGVTEQLRALTMEGKQEQALDRELAEAAYWQLRRSYDAKHGGFGAAPKFPRPSVLQYLLRVHAAFGHEDALEMATHTLREMAAGGMHDQLGGGFHRYSVDERWFVPHFEKMLYDQAQLAVAYVEAFQATGEQAFARTAEDVLTYVLRDLRSSEGGFYSAEDADSTNPENPAEHGEGAFYIWRQAEIEKLLGAPAARGFCERYGVLPEGNVETDPHGEFRGRNILYDTAAGGADGASASRETLFAARERRPRPHLDRKVLTAWNALMISALARSGAVLQKVEYIERAKEAARFLLRTMYEPVSGRLLRRYCEGEAAIPAFADDYAFLAQALLDLFEATGQGYFLQFSMDLCRRGLEGFRDSREGGFFATTPEASDVLLRMKDDYDGAEPSASAIAADVLLRLGHLTGDERLAEEGKRTLEWLAMRMAKQPAAAPQALCALLRWFAEPGQVAIRCADANEAARTVAARHLRTFAPFISVLLLPDGWMKDVDETAPFLAALERAGDITVYECRNFTCALPVTMEAARVLEGK